MHYFGISEALIKKTQDELKQKMEANQGKQIKQGMLVDFEKSMIALATKIGGESKISELK